MIYHTEHFVNSWKQGIWNDFIDLHTETNTRDDGSKGLNIDATAMFVYLFNHLYHNMLEGKANEEELLSWKSFIVDNQDKIIKPVVYVILDKLGLIRACRALGAVLIDNYDMNSSLFPLPIDKLDRRYENKIISLLFNNNGKKNYLKFFWLSPWENILYIIPINQI